LCNESLDRNKSEREGFFDRIVTAGKTGLYQWNPENKQEPCNACTRRTPTKKIRSAKSAVKIMATAFWDQDGVPQVEYFLNKLVITGETYSKTMRSLRRAIDKEKTSAKMQVGVILLLYDIAPVHR
jgi:hypothetical protein